MAQAQEGYSTLSEPSVVNPFRRKSRRLNIDAILQCLFGPWILYSIVFAATSFSLRYDMPRVANAIVAAAVFVVIVAFYFAADAVLRKRWHDDGYNVYFEPTWFVFLFVMTLIALIAGIMSGNTNFDLYMAKYFDYMKLNVYERPAVNPTLLRGEQVMDGGRVVFIEDTRVALDKSMGFRDKIMYCVAPIVHGTDQPQTYDFWAVGTDCCSGQGPDFHCGEYNNPNGDGGLRLLNDKDRAFYRLAVQQAESMYGIRAAHPLFFEWVEDPVGIVDNYRTAGIQNYFLGVFSHLLFQAFCVSCAALAFAKLGFQRTM
mmetsp:Transcript_20733/g.48167  ORF Transcript_20733/g.48167 Transcript_20733/m.48167 type:complete len:315 (+) Transcript_20733:154-1098(+)|eukprot:CAMPEP_0178388852 /NCGR_PEP_ID=MMETSP0689_2-20121128/9808_1 /TAXON_ID=160604 /ORGANISM="Amphidinium massartii, Strain CS-259" /LENGTH=314 /DNA_ID=CAMNT_0020009271 /DNA_START=103 /DNA_END=1047 /DNA_ORIENTATION=+